MATEAERTTTATGPLIRLRLAPGQRLWRIGPAWSALAGALLAGASLPDRSALLRLAAALVLADLLWGVLRQHQADGVALRRRASAVLLPYSQPAAPLAGLLAALATDDEGASWVGTLLGLALIAAVSSLIGFNALLLSAGAIAIQLGARAWARRMGGAALSAALLDVMLPWLLGASLTGGVAWPVAALGAAFTLLQWGALRGGVWAWVGHGAVLAALAALQRPWALAVAVVLFAPPVGWLAAQRRDAAARALPWWWGALMGVALTIRFS